MKKTNPSRKCRRNMRKRITLLVLSALSLLGANAQSDDFGLDFSVGAEKKIRPGMSFSLESEARTQDNTRKIERWTVGGTFDMRLWQNDSKTFNLKASAGWKYMWMYNLATCKTHYSTMLDGDGNLIEYEDGYNEHLGYWRNRHRTSISLGASYKLNKRWSLSLKETFQYTHFCKGSTTINKYRIDDDEDDDTPLLDETKTKEYKAKDRTVLRSKLTVQYNIRHCPANPYASVDYGCGLNYSTNKWKFTAGTDINLTQSKQHKLDIFYRYITENDDEDPNGHLIGLGYKLKF